MAHGTGDGHAFVELRGDTVHIVYDEASAFKAVDWERVRGLASRLGLHVQAVVQELNKVAATARNWDRATWWFDDLNPRPQLIAAYEKPELFPGDWLRQYRQHAPHWPGAGGVLAARVPRTLASGPQEWPHAPRWARGLWLAVGRKVSEYASSEQCAGRGDGDCPGQQPTTPSAGQE